MELKSISWKSFKKPSVWVSVFAISLVIPILAAPAVRPTPLMVQIRAVTLLFCILLLIRDGLTHLIVGGQSIGRFFLKTVLYIFVIKFGPSMLHELYLQIKANPEISIAFGLSVLGVLALNWISDLIDRILFSFQDLSWKNQKPSIKDLKTAEKKWEPRLCTSKDISVTCIHEAGHALVYAALPNIPEQFRMKALPQSDGRGRLGSITSVEWNGILRPKDFILIQLLMLLAGQQAEKCIFNEIFDGAHSDLRHWQQEAKNYLMLGFGGIYFSPIEDDYEAEQNRLTLEKLREEQSDLLLKFFKLNQQVLEDLAKELQAKGRLLKDDVEPFLAQVQFVDGFPKLSQKD
ncbi:hypothetical protein [Acaryochloris marina]|uniref:hypothetical protein n=1 Tax=Acaryochloris marina TaxID=155978 RepID=UPI001BB086BB|nr:hypothetical protein [Acaryochloris marina]QUY45454.1 hypothetical protein I1H34_27140 [Acaryochloris marina S15]